MVQQKNIKNNECCSAVAQTANFGNTDIIVQTMTGSCCNKPTLPEDTGSISFGCMRLDEILEQKIHQGMTIVDFGSGPGHDLFIAAKYVGPTGKAIGIDFTDAMIEEAQQHIISYGLKNVELVKSNIQNINLPDNIADIIISNCVINLAINKVDVFREAFRLLWCGGVLIDADIITENHLPIEITNNKEDWCSCIGGALTAAEYTDLIKKAGFQDIHIENIANYAEISSNNHVYSGILYATKP